MAMMNRTRDLLMEGFEGLVREGSFSWALPRRGASPVDDADDPDSSSSSSSGKQPSISGLSPKANAVVSRCSRVLGTSTDELQYDFDMQASDSIKQPRNYARNFLEYCCLRALAHASQVAGYLSDKSFRRLNFDMMLAWEVPSSSSELTVKVEVDNTVSLEAFSRIAPAIPTITDVVTCSNLFDVLSSSSGGRLTFPVYDKYLTGLDRAIKKMKGQSESSLLSAQRSQRGERIVEVDGTLTTQPVLEHVGISTWPGRLTLTDHALYFEALRVVTYDKPKAYELAEDLKQSVKPELTGPWGSRLFDKAVMYKSTTLTEPVIIEFPELAGHFRRDYWLAIISEILYVHRFVRKFDISGVDKEETILKAVLSIMRLQAIEELAIPVSNRFESLLMFNLCDKLPGGDVILETLAGSISSRRSTQVNQPGTSSGRHSMSPFTVLSNLGVVSPINKGERLFVGEIVVGEMSALQKVVNESMNNYKKVELAQATVDGVKVDGLDTNLAVMKELLSPVSELWRFLVLLASWDEPIKSMVFCFSSSYIIIRGWLVYFLVLVLLFSAAFMFLTRLTSHGKPMTEVKVTSPPPMNTMEQLLAVQNAISKVEELVQDANIVLLKIRALLLAFPSQATDRAILALVVMALSLAFVPTRLLVLMMFLEAFTNHSPPRRASTERWTRRLREWWFSIPAAPVVVEKDKEDKKTK
ncbi:uncharacterized protein [Oryza sativa Japonica Group]|uniref:Expressed protein n=2 Tax=Oryza sativa subsp. japonica TaxID=39947 RepID=Q33B99_ORYSJ|nr:uncharacterized protein LOC4348023 isoform X1 [Oryza sativa Japonica Group]KAB8111951.1 hypothetical protein EE612_049833 [Oryza sativa]ABB46672.1 expressed protein [Oryza sativa Japonica Group]KAF2912468.1 hypothetical protein DAI22_10g013200 [Oryza sativa Japonica Group]BAF26000.1 Os10g0127700 [Oryza sativa Japonica Group]BAG93186.1 unnamed protein product [Oryza sativa Japonica Group]|eukprot:NP_001064086.1 Os10g0127700 [Oryza sativa Japonica Group]